MRSDDNMSANTVPAFLTKLWTLVENPQWNELISWDVSGKSFHVFDQARFAKEILPLYFKHSNITSFIRQLNMYGFRKVLNVEQGLKHEKDDVEFQHPYFQRGQEHLLEHIRRKTTQHMPVTLVKQEPYQLALPQSDDMEKIIEDVHQVKGKQDIMNTKLDAMKRENEVLWREVASLRQKHIKQQQIVNKLIQFLVHIVRPNRSVPSTKRKMPLMISDMSHNEAKIPKRGVPSTDTYSVQSPLTHADAMSSQSGGPIIHEIDDVSSEQISSCGDAGPLGDSTSSSLSLPSDLLSSSTKQLSDSEYGLKSDDLHLFNAEILPEDNNEMPRNISISELVGMSPEDGTNGLTLNPPSTAVSGLTMAVPSTATSSIPDSEKSPFKGFSRQKSIHEVTDHVATVDSDLDNLKDLLTGSNFPFDSSTLLNLFSSDNQINIPGSENLLSGIDFKGDDNDGNTTAGNELVQFRSGEDSPVPDLFDLADLSKEEDDPLSASGVNAFKSDSLDTPLPQQVSAEDLD